ncbi:type II secretion system protein [Gemmata sp. JC717]|uniref:pilus assembly FimT family protein n=1 Tax=Gemmata algarum TaxID=2975278 RepID=UPI0021BA3E32|nr:type II secretion system protein [Gemmata algarum]MDY3552349.1 type II secretion system protein [Gemmata algarum]
MICTQSVRRSAFTLVELLVGISIFLALAGLVLMLYPGARDQDRVRYAVSDAIAHLRMAQSMAARDKAPRGIRFVVNSSVSPTTPDPTNDLKIDPRWVTELQYIEQPPPLVPKRNPLSDPNAGPSYTSTGYNPDNDPRVQFNYTVVQPPAAGQPVPNPPPGTILTRTCTIQNLDPVTQVPLVQTGCTLTLPTLGFWSRITSATSSGSNVTVTLEVYPDAIMGGSTFAQVYHFAVYLNAVPLVGEPTVPLPKNICVDLNRSIPQTNGNSDFDILFGPDGKVIGSSSGQTFLWIRDFTKVAPYSGSGATASWFNGTTTPTLMDSLRKGGEQHVVVIRSSGTIASNNAAWPANNVNYANDAEPYSLARDLGR